MDTVKKSVLIPLCNLYANGDLTARVSVAGQVEQLNLIIDTGSSGLAIKSCNLPIENLAATSLAQHQAYGAGDWTGPVVKTQVTLGEPNTSKFHCHIKNVHVALTESAEENTFVDADGIIGLAYESLNIAHDLSALLKHINADTNLTYPWPKKLVNSSPKVLKQQVLSSPKQPLLPYFDELANQNVVANEFAFVVHRSSIYQGVDKKHQHDVPHPLNTGILILGEPKIHSHLHNNDFVCAKVVHDKYYNVHIRSVFVEGAKPIEFPELEENKRHSYISNGIVDSGASAIVFPKQVFKALIKQLVSYNDAFSNLLEPFKQFTGKEIGVDLAKVSLNQWPNICIEVDSPTGASSILTLTPQTYWQTHAPVFDQISFKITTLEGWPNQGILGLPLLNNYFTIFNRAAGQNGQIEFANKAFSPHLQSDDFHRNLDNCHQHFKSQGHIL